MKNKVKFRQLGSVTLFSSAGINSSDRILDLSDPAICLY